MKRRESRSKIQSKRFCGLTELSGSRITPFSLPATEPIRTAPNEPLFGVVLVFRDFSARKEAEQKLRDSEALLSAVVRQLPVGVGVMDPTGKWIACNAFMDEFVPQGIRRSCLSAHLAGEFSIRAE